MKKIAFSLLALGFLNACQTTASLGPGEVLGTDIGTILSREAGLSLSAIDEDKMNREIEKALYFSDDGLTTSWYAGYSTRIRPIEKVADRRDRDCRRFRHGFMIEGDWHNTTAVACRERNIAWYLIANRWDNYKDQDTPPRRDRGNGTKSGHWKNLSDTLKGNPSDQSFDDFGPRNKQR